MGSRLGVLLRLTSLGDLQYSAQTVGLDDRRYGSHYERVRRMSPMGVDDRML